MWFGEKRYAPFGEPQLQESAKQTHKVDYTGHVYDAELGLHYMGGRYYDPKIGRFMSNDPVGFIASHAVSFNRYAYGNNNPYRFYDPDGKFTSFNDSGISDRGRLFFNAKYS